MKEGGTRAHKRGRAIDMDTIVGVHTCRILLIWRWMDGWIPTYILPPVISHTASLTLVASFRSVPSFAPWTPA